MKLRHEIEYAASPDEVFAMLADPAFRQRSLDAMGVLSAEVSIERTGEGMEVLIDQVQPTEGIPSFARRFAGETTRAVQKEEWLSPSGGSLCVDTPGKPSEIRGTLSLVANGSGTTEVFDGECRVKVPLIGGRLENLMAGLFRKGMDAEQSAGAAWLRGER